MTDTELRDSIARELFVESIKTSKDAKATLAIVAESCFIIANAFMEAREKNTKKMIDEMSKKRSYIGAHNE